MEEVRSRLDVNSESVMDKSALNDDQQELSELESGLIFCSKYYSLMKSRHKCSVLLTFWVIFSWSSGCCDIPMFGA